MTMADNEYARMMQASPKDLPGYDDLAELETLRSQIASLRALAKTWEDERREALFDGRLATAEVHGRHAKAITAIVGKE